MRVTARLLFLTILCGLGANAAETDAGVEQTETLRDLESLAASERKKLMASMPREELENALAEIPAETLLAVGQKTLDSLGVYSVQLTKEERVEGEWIGPQILNAVIREATPLALRIDYVGGPGKGRKVLYNAKLREKELRAKESGILSIAGGVWVDIDSSLTRRDSRHPITDLGYGPVFNFLSQDIQKAKPHGGHKRVNKGIDTSGAYCMEFTAPAALKDPYARKAEICMDPVKAVLTAVTVWDEKGLLERFQFELKESRMKVPDDFFTPEAAGL